jgi:hypothetical protein
MRSAHREVETHPSQAIDEKHRSDNPIIAFSVLVVLGKANAMDPAVGGDPHGTLN